MSLRILGVDPGSRLAGFGVIEAEGRAFRHITHGTLTLVGNLEEKLADLFKNLTAIIEETRPNAIVVEKIFLARNAMSALKLGHARGVVVLCAGLSGAELFEYSATQVKSAVTGHGHAEKSQVERMVQILLRTGGKAGLEFQTADGSDALALALAHATLHSVKVGQYDRICRR